MKKYSILTAALALVLVIGTRSARAQGGCDDSPENPTLILAALAGGAYGVSALRHRMAKHSAARRDAAKQ